MHPVAKPSSAPRPAAKERPIKVIARNPRARHDYEILHTYEAGIVLRGTEVKTLRQGRGSIVGAFGRLRGGEVWLEGIHIPPYEQGNIHNHEPLRSRKLLMHKSEIRRLIGQVEQKGHALIPLELHFKGPNAKVVLALGRGKKEHDKRDVLRQRDAEREVARVLRRR
jgi:SsrA-binding protein